MKNSILAPAVFLASCTSFLFWGPALLQFVLSVIIGVPLRRVVNWTAVSSMMTGARKDASWAGHDFSRSLEAPVLFYVLSLVLAIAGEPRAFDLFLLWAYSITRLAYSTSWIFRTTGRIRPSLFFTTVGIQQILTIRCLLQFF
jgi:hypothetical protein